MFNSKLLENVHVDGAVYEIYVYWSKEAQFRLIVSVNTTKKIFDIELEYIQKGCKFRVFSIKVYI